jgi:hypothetical protein
LDRECETVSYARRPPGRPFRRPRNSELAPVADLHPADGSGLVPKGTQE